MFQLSFKSVSLLEYIPVQFEMKIAKSENFYVVSGILISEVLVMGGFYGV